MPIKTRAGETKMIKPKKQTSTVFFRVALLAAMSVLSIGFGLFSTTQRTSAATSSTINFQARLLTAAGATVPDGNYNIEFKIYNASSSSGSSQGSCSGDSACLWTETRTTSNKVRVTNGYLTVNLGSVTAFGAINWDQEMWLTMNVGGTGTPGWDGEMTPRLKLTGVPYAFQAGGLANTNGANRSTLGWVTQTASNSILLPNEGGTICLQSSANCGFLTTSAAATSYVQLQGSTPGTAQTGNLNISGTAIAGTALQSPTVYANTLDTVSGTTTLNVGTTNATSGINLNQNVTVASSKTVTIQGATSITTNSATALQVGNSGGNKILTVDTSANIVKIISGAMSDIASDGTSGGALQIGPTSSYNLLADDNEVMARNGTSPTTLYLQKAGGGLRVQASVVLYKPASDSTTAFQIQPGSSSVPAFNVDTSNSRVGIGTDTPISSLDVYKGLLNTGINQNFNIFSIDSAAAAQNVGGGIGFGGNADSVRAFAAIQGLHESSTTTDYAGALRIFTRPSGGDLQERIRVDSTGKVGINKTNPGYTLDVTGDINTTTALRIAGTSVCDTTGATGCIAKSGSGYYIHNQTTVQAANVFVQAATTGTVAAKFQAFNGGTGDIADFLNGTGTTVASIGSSGAVLFKPSTDTQSVFQIQPSGSSTPVFDVDTSNSRVGIGTSTPGSTLTAAVSNTQITAPIATFQQGSTGDATIELKNTNASSSFYISMDNSNSSGLAINSYTNAATSITGTPAHVQTANTALLSGGATTIPKAFTSNNTAGNLIVAAFTWGLGSGTATCSDSQGNSYSAATIANDAGQVQSMGVCYASNIKAGANTVTVTFSSSMTFRQLLIHEYSGVAVTNPLDAAIVSNIATGTTSANGYTSTSATTTSNGDLIYGAMFDDAGVGSPTYTPGTGFTQRYNDAAFVTEDMIQSNAGSTAATFTGTLAHNYMAFMLTFRPARTTASANLTDTNTNSLFTLSQTGAAKFQNSTDSATGFVVQNASGISVFSVDTLNGKVTIGTGSTGTVTPALLILNSSTNTSDPTGVTGAMYYSTITNKFRCYENSVWVNCIGSLTSANTQASGALTATSATAFSITGYSPTIPANYCATGRAIHVIANGTYTTTTASLTFTSSVRLGATIVGSASPALATPGTTQTNKGWGIDFYMTCNAAASAASAVNGQGFARIYNSTTTNDQVGSMATNGTTNFATNGSLAINIYGNWSGSGGSAVLQQLIVQGL